MKQVLGTDNNLSRNKLNLEKKPLVLHDHAKLNLSIVD